MASTDVSSNTPREMPEAATIDMKLEVVTLPVSGVDRARRFYQSLGWRLDTDIAAGDAFRARTRNVAPTSPMPRSAIRTATGGCCRRSRRGFRAGNGKSR